MQKKLFLTLGLVLSLVNLHAKEKSHGIHPQPLKIGYANVNYILGLLPETKAVGSEVASYRKQAGKQLEEKYEEYHQKEQTFLQGYESMDGAARNKKGLELQQLQEGLSRLEIELQEKLVSKKASLLAPIYEKIKNAIVQVAKENRYTHVLNADVESMSVLLYANEEYNISDQILKKLGINLDKTKDTKK